jgi:hypothetical protein
MRIHNLSTTWCVRMRLLMILLLTGCGGSGIPDAESAAVSTILPYDSSEAALLATTSSVVVSWKERLDGARKEWTIGNADGPFGRVISLAADTAALFVSDDLMQHVLMIAHDGRVIRTFAEHGSGPLEMSRVVGIVSDGEAELVLADFEKLRAFTHPATQQLQDVGTLRPGANITGLCGTGRRLFMRVLNAGRPEVVMAASFNDSARAVFGSAPVISSSVPHPQAAGVIACTQDPERVIITYEGVPTIYAYYPSGEEAWRTTIEHFVPTRWVDTTFAGRQVVKAAPEPRHQLVSMVALPPDALLVQVMLLQPSTTGGLTGSGLDSYLIETERGTGIFLGQRVPKIDAADRHYFWSVMHGSAGYPTLTSYRMGNSQRTQ